MELHLVVGGWGGKHWRAMQIADQEDNKDGRCAGEVVSTGALGRAFRWQAAPTELECRSPLAGEGLFKNQPGARRLGLVH
ncbi:MAG: hypothetical protein DI621_28130 [Pseudomonas protegens]|nr:MAG: hypothetical protein DI621_28130 [Pseudomonas protegens]